MIALSPVQASGIGTLGSWRHPMSQYPTWGLRAMVLKTEQFSGTLVMNRAYRLFFRFLIVVYPLVTSLLSHQTASPLLPGSSQISELGCQHAADMTRDTCLLCDIF